MDTHTHIHTHRTTTVTLAAHACRGLIINNVGAYYTVTSKKILCSLGVNCLAAPQHIYICMCTYQPTPTQLASRYFLLDWPAVRTYVLTVVPVPYAYEGHVCARG